MRKRKDKKAKPCHVCSVLESGFLPGSLYTLSRWYSRGELAKRSVIFFYGNTLSAAFGSLLYAGCLRIDGHLGVKAWQWYASLPSLLCPIAKPLSVLSQDFHHLRRFDNQ